MAWVSGEPGSSWAGNPWLCPGQALPTDAGFTSLGGMVQSIEVLRGGVWQPEGICDWHDRGGGLLVSGGQGPLQGMLQDRESSGPEAGKLCGLASCCCCNKWLQPEAARVCPALVGGPSIQDQGVGRVRHLKAVHRLRCVSFQPSRGHVRPLPPPAKPVMWHLPSSLPPA